MTKLNVIVLPIISAKGRSHKTMWPIDFGHGRTIDLGARTLKD